jgi:flagellar capping protein FliD
MSISQLSNLLATSYSTSNSVLTQAAAKADAISTSLNKSSTKIQTQLDATSASLSTLGKFKASVSMLQTAAQSLSQFSATSSSDDVKKGLSSFIANFNTVVAATKAAATDSSEVDRISRGMTRAMSADLSKISELRNLGFSKASDGSLKLDAAKFEAAYKASPAAVQSTLAKLGKLADKSANKELASDGRIGSSMDTLVSKSSVLKLQQNALTTASQRYTSLMQSSAGNTLSAYTSYR